MNRNCVRLKLGENSSTWPAASAVGGELDPGLAANGTITDLVVKCFCMGRPLRAGCRVPCGVRSGNSSIPLTEPVIIRPNLRIIRVRTPGVSFATIPLACCFSFIFGWFS